MRNETPECAKLTGEKTAYEGSAQVLGDDVNTDYIISSRRKRDTLDEKELSRYLMEDLDPHFAARVRPGDMLVAGANFGCGSAMEIAALVIKGAGIKVVLAKSFARAFYRNGVNNGLLLVECDTDFIRQGHSLAVAVQTDGLAVSNRTTGETRMAAPLPPVQADILNAGGLVEVMRQRARRTCSTTSPAATSPTASPDTTTDTTPVTSGPIPRSKA